MILIVDDNQENLFALKTLLSLHNFRVDTAASGEEALKKIIKSSYSLIVLDVQMPEMDGFEVAEAISGYSKSKDIPIIFLSAVNTHKKFITKGYASGGIDYVTKPFDPDILLLKIKTFYRLSEQTRRLNEMDAFLRAEIEYRKQAESKLQEYVDELKWILESIPQIAFTLNADGSVEFANNLWYEFIGDRDVFPVSEGLSLSDCIKEALRAQKQIIRQIKIKAVQSAEYRYHMLYLTPLTKGGQIAKWVGIFTDIHEQKMSAQLLEKKVDERTSVLKQLIERLESSNKELRQFAFVASHDLQEPLRKIQTFSNLIVDRLLPEENQAQVYLKKISTSAERLRTLITDLLDYANLQGEDNFVLTDMNVLIRETLSDLELKIREKKARLSITEFPVMEVMPIQMRQLFQNLVSNSIKFCKNEEAADIHISAERVKHKAFDAPPDDDGMFCRVVFQDNGIGFNEQFLDRIFDIFQRLNVDARYKGNGIGLAIVKKVVERHNGIIRAHGKENEGATFTFVLPLRQTVINRNELL